MKIQIIVYLSVIFLLLFNFSCNNSIIYYDEIEDEDGIWNIHETYSFQANIHDLSQTFDVLINLKLKKDFLTENLWVFITTKSPSNTIQTDTILYYISDEYGKWYGEEKRKYIDYKLMYKPMIRFPEKGDYNFTILHGMREKDLPQIQSVALLIQKSKLTESDN